MNRFNPLLVSALCALFLVAFQADARAFTIGFDHEYSGGEEPQGSTPWLTAEFATQSVGSVLLTLASDNLVDEEFVTKWYFGFNPAKNVNNLNFAWQAGSDLQANSISTGQDSFIAGGGYRYDLLFTYDTSNGPSSNRFETGLISSYLITAPGLVEEDFNFFGIKPIDGSLLASAHIQGIGPDAEGSGWVTGDTNPSAVPEPSTLLLLGLGGLGLLARDRLRRRG